MEVAVNAVRQLGCLKYLLEVASYLVPCQRGTGINHISSLCHPARSRGCRPWIWHLRYTVADGVCDHSQHPRKRMEGTEVIPFVRQLSDLPSSNPSAGPFRTPLTEPSSQQYHLNEDIIEMSDDAFEALRQQNDIPVSAEEVTQAYANKCLRFIRSQEPCLNYINVSTLVHRLGRFVARSGTQEYLCRTQGVFVGRLMALVFLHIKSFDRRQIANTVWGMGKIGPNLKKVPIPYITFNELMDEIMNHAKARVRLEGLSHRHLSNFLYGLACLEYVQNKPLVEEFSARGLKVMDEFLDSELSNFVWALGKLGYYDRKDVLAEAVKSAKKRVNSMGPQEVSNFLWGLAVMEYKDCKDLLDMLLAPHTQSLWTKDKTSQTISMFIWSAHSMGYKLNLSSVDDFISAPFSKVTKFDADKTVDLSTFQAQHVVTILYACSQFDYESKRVKDFVMATKIFFHTFASLFTCRDAAMMAWSLMMMDKLDAATMSSILTHVHRIKPPDQLNPEDIRQLYQCLIHLRIFYPNMSLPQVISPQVEKQWKGVWVMRQRTSPLPHWISLALVHLEKMGHVCRARCMIGGIVNTTTLDFEDGMKYALEGLSHSRRYTNEYYAPRANLSWKKRVLRILGYEIVELEESEWENLFGEHNIQEYLNQRVNAAKAKRRVELLHTT